MASNMTIRPSLTGDAGMKTVDTVFFPLRYGKIEPPIQGKFPGNKTVGVFR